MIKSIGGIAVSMAVFAAAVPALAAWSGTVPAALPPWGGTVDNYSVSVVKQTSNSTFSVYGVRETNLLDPHAMLINSNGQDRSSWAAIRQGQTITSESNRALIGYYCYSRAGSNAVEPN